MGVFSLNNNDIDSSKLYLDVSLITETDKGDGFEISGLKTIGLFKDNIGFGITRIAINISTSLQPIIEIDFKDMYGNAAFNELNTGTEKDYSVLFSWPPPKFTLMIKGYLGYPVKWALSLKRISFENDPSDGSYNMKATFVPNVYGVFADIPFLFLHAIKKLKTGTKTPEPNTVYSIFDIIDGAKVVSQERKKISDKYDKIRQELIKIKSSEDLFGLFENNTTVVLDQKIDGFKKITLNLPLSITKQLKNTTLSDYENGRDFTGQTKDYNRILFSSYFGDRGVKPEEGINALLDGSDRNEMDRQRKDRISIVDENLKLIEKQIDFDSYASNQDKIDKLTISSVLGQIANDTGYIAGSILMAGKNGREMSLASRKENQDVIGLAFPLTHIDDGNGNRKQVPFEDNGTKKHEMRFVREFLQAITEGVAKDLQKNKDIEENGITEENKLINRINNLEILSDNPYSSTYESITENILLRSAVISNVTRSDDPNQPSEYGGFFNGYNVDQSQIETAASKDVENITNQILSGLSNEDELRLKKFCRFFRDVLKEGSSSLNNFQEVASIPSVSGITVSVNLDEDVKAASNTTIGKFFQNELKHVEFTNTNNLTISGFTNNGIFYTAPNPKTKDYHYVIFNDISDGIPTEGELKDESVSKAITGGFVKIKKDDEKIETFLHKLIDNRILVDYKKLKSGKSNSFNDLLFTEKDKIKDGGYFAIYYNSNSARQIFRLFDVGDVGEFQRICLRKMCEELLDKIDKKNREVDNAIRRVLGEQTEQEDILYQQMHHIFSQWNSLLLEADSFERAEDLGEHFVNTFDYQYSLQEINSNKTVNVRNSVINTEALNKIDANTTSLSMFQNICSKNNFLFLPIPGGASSLRGTEEQMFLPQLSSKNVSTGSKFLVMFMPTPESKSLIKGGKGDGGNKNKPNENFEAKAFEVKFGDPNNKIIKKVSIHSDDNRTTAESIVNLQRIIDKTNENKVFAKDCSMLSVYEGRSYIAKCETLGNAQISPTQFFFIRNLPLFNGLYQVMKVSHTITPNDMTTDFEGVKMRITNGSYLAVPPTTTDDLKNGSGSKNVEQPNVNSGGNNNSSDDNIKKISDNYGSVIYKTPKLDFNGQIFTEAYEIKDGVTIITNPFYFSGTGKKLNVANKPEKDIINKNLIALQELLILPLYKQFNSKIVINSGFRNEIINRSLPEPGSTTSNHMQGLACDIYLPNKERGGAVDMYNWIMGNWETKQLPVKELILERRESFWLHIAITESYKFDPKGYKFYTGADARNNIFKIYDVKGSPQYVFQDPNKLKKVDLAYAGRYPGKYIDGSSFG